MPRVTSPSEVQIKQESENEERDYDIHKWPTLEPSSYGDILQLVKKEPCCEDNGSPVGGPRMEDLHLIYEGHVMKEEEMAIGPEVWLEPALGICKSTKALESTLHQHYADNDKAPSYNNCKKTSQSKNKGCKKSKNIQSKQLTCNVCDRKFRYKYSLSRHLLIHAGEKPYKCDICEKKYRRKSHLTEHQRLHSGEELYSCDNCSKKFTTPSKRKLHLLVHSGGNNFSCDVCGKNFSYKHNLTRHLHIHTQETKFTCNVCGKIFLYWSNLLKHQLVHNGEKSFTCDICGKKFFYKAYLMIHLLIHSKEKEIKCDICDKVFLRKGHLKIHEMQSHVR